MIGVDTALNPEPNRNDGVDSDVPTTIIGATTSDGTTTSSPNVISGNLGNGIELGDDVATALVVGNDIGVTVGANGTTTALGNGGDGVRSFAVSTTIGGSVTVGMTVYSGGGI